jgi:hypothetical protein
MMNRKIGQRHAEEAAACFSLFQHFSNQLNQ